MKTKWRVGGRRPYGHESRDAAVAIQEAFAVAKMDPRCLAWEWQSDGEGEMSVWRWELKHLPTGCECEELAEAVS